MNLSYYQATCCVFAHNGESGRAFLGMVIGQIQKCVKSQVSIYAWKCLELSEYINKNNILHSWDSMFCYSSEQMWTGAFKNIPAQGRKETTCFLDRSGLHSAHHDNSELSEQLHVPGASGRLPPGG